VYRENLKASKIKEGFGKLLQSCLEKHMEAALKESHLR
jgi:hypothetical protein